MTDKTRHHVADLLSEASRELQPKRIRCAMDRGLGRLEAEILLGHVLKKDLAWLLTHSGDPVRGTQVALFRSLVRRRTRHEPIAYLTGTRGFYGRDFVTDKRALIPRPETEILVDLTLAAMRRGPTSRDLVWDVGTGSGAVAISVAKAIAPRKVLATDVSDDALRLARKNAKLLRASNVTFLHADLLDADVRDVLDKHRRADAGGRLFIAANLPYLPMSDRKHIDKDVVDFEPSSALFAEKGGLALVERFLRQLASFDVHFTSAFLEFDTPQSKKIRALARTIYPHATITIHKDLAHRDRVLEITNQ
ncbi:MAG: peptide chain release factor N(5)-glutamine methyltransferase [Patescibacteria group bacterium]